MYMYIIIQHDGTGKVEIPLKSILKKTAGYKRGNEKGPSLYPIQRKQSGPEFDQRNPISINGNRSGRAGIGTGTAAGTVIIDNSNAVNDFNSVTRTSRFAFATTGAGIFVNIRGHCKLLTWIGNN